MAEGNVGSYQPITSVIQSEDNRRDAGNAADDLGQPASETD